MTVGRPDKIKNPGRGPSPQYEDHARSIDGKDWKTPHGYIEGIRVTWRGVRLVCTRGHYCGDSAWHPWDPGSGWHPRDAAILWAPDGPDEERKLRELLPRIGELEDEQNAKAEAEARARGTSDVFGRVRDDERGYLGRVLLYVTGAAA